LAAKLTGWKVDIKSETEFSQEEEEIEFEEGEEADGRCAAVLSAGRRCPNAALAGARYCGLPQHQALARFPTNQVTVLGTLADEEIQRLADPDADDAEVAPLVEGATAAFEQAESSEGAAETEEADMPTGDSAAGAEAEPPPEDEQGGDELEPEEALSQDAATEADESDAETAPVGAESPDDPEATVEQPEE
jgi:N utilization substance protein A